MLKRLSKSPSLEEFINKLEGESSFLLEGLLESSKALIAALVAKSTGKSVILVTGGSKEDRLFNDLQFFDETLPIEFPAWEILPGEEIAPSPDILGKRFEALNAILQKKTPSVILCPITSILQKIIPLDQAKSLLTTWEKGDKLIFDEIPNLLTNLGYKRQPIVTDKGQFAIRGGIVDLFPVSATEPYRIDFFGNEIENIKTFDPIGQKSTNKASKLFLSPAQELPLLQKSQSLCHITDLIQDPWIFWDDLVALEDILVSIKKMPGAKSQFFSSIDDIFAKTKHHVFFTNQNIEELSPTTTTKQRTKHFQTTSFEAFNKSFTVLRFFHPLQKIVDLEDIPEENQVIFLNRTKHEQDEVEKKIQSHSFSKVSFETGSLTSGFNLLDLSTSIVSNSLFSGKTPIRRQKWRASHHTPTSEFHALSPGDLIVHYHSGIGKFLGLEKQKNHLGVDTEFLILEFANESKLFVPLSQAYLVSRYIGTRDESPHLSELGGKRWQKIKEAATAQIVGYANDLLQRQAERVLEGGFKFHPDSTLLEQFEKEFPYEETEDQLIAIHDIKQDMMSNRPMDRLVCGDVGYGKTEVAMRAAFKAVVDGGKQVAVLVPTTVLAMQHFDTFSQRMSGFPISIDVVSRFRTAKQSKQTIEKLKNGQVDILIGTHRLLSQDICFKDLGLIIIDEEQRFGVRSKEHLKKFKVGVDCLTLSATPIPRTLHMSLVTAREMSVIATPPQDRLPIKTIIAENDPELIQNALLRELSRNGQAFYIHNRVETIYGRAEEIQKLLPSARIDVVHGQMDTDDIDSIFHKFKLGQTDLLFATTIVESGIDIPNANTILIDRSDTYGIADLYQLRGRVGRWNRAAYAYFLIPKHARMTETAKKRLSALAEASGYGGGMKIAIRDLEIRGAGDILGVQQSGQVSSIGFHLYCKLLKRAIDSLKKRKPISFLETKMEFSFPASLPDYYVNDVSLRMEIYHRIGESASNQEIDDLLNELKDRFGKPPMEVIWLYHLSRIRIFALECKCTLLKFGNLSFIAERQLGKELQSHTFMMPKKVQEPALLEAHVTAELKKVFLI